MYMLSAYSICACCSRMIFFYCTLEFIQSEGKYDGNTAKLTKKYGSSEQEICGKFCKKSAEFTMKRCQSPLDP